MSEGFAVRTRRMRAGLVYGLINQVCTKINGSRIVWQDRPLLAYIDRKGEAAVYFQRHGNRWNVWLEFMSEDQQVLDRLKNGFPEVFI